MKYLRNAKFRFCPLCVTKRVYFLVELAYAHFDDSPLSKRYNLVACEKCGLVYSDLNSTTDDFTKYYSQNQHYLSDNYGNGTSSNKENYRYATVLSKLEKYILDKTVKIIDVGSAQGGFLNYLRIHAYTNLLAIDPLPECIQVIKQNNIKAKIGTADHLPIDNNTVDVVTLSHVLEHLLDFQGVMEELNRVLTEDGLVYAEVPSLENGPSFQKAPLWDFLFEHINHFSLSHLNNLFELNGFKILESGHKKIYNGNGTVGCAWAIFQKILRDKKKRLSYFDMKNNVKNAFDLQLKYNTSELDEIIKNNTPCYIWGISSYMQLMIERLGLRKCNIISFIDKSAYKQSKFINSIPILKPEVLNNVSSEKAVIFPLVPCYEEMNHYLDSINFSGKRITI